MNSKNIKMISGIAVILVGGFGAYQFLMPKAQVSDTSINTSSIVLEKSSLSKTISASGSIDSIQSMNVTSTLNAKVKTVSKHLGDLVKKGDVLAQIDTAALQEDIKVAQKTYDDAKYLYDQKLADAYKTLDDAKRAYAAGYAEGTAEWQYVYDDAINWDSKTQAAQSAYDNLLYNDTTVNAKNNLDALIESRNNARLVAPMDGIVSYANVSEGNTSTGILYTISNASEFKVTSSIAPYDINLVYSGQSVNVNVDDVNTQYQAEITRVSPIANANGDYDIELMLSGDQSRLRMGMDAQIEIVIDEKENIFVLPQSSIMSENGKQYILAYDEATQSSTQYEVTLGLQNDYYVEISGEGLSEGMLILSDPTNALNYADPSVTPGGPFGRN